MRTSKSFRAECGRSKSALWAAPSGAEAREAEKLLGDFLKEAEAEQEEEEQSQTRAGERTGGVIVS